MQNSMPFINGLVEPIESAENMVNGVGICKGMNMDKFWGVFIPLNNSSQGVLSTRKKKVSSNRCQSGQEFEKYNPHVTWSGQWLASYSYFDEKYSNKNSFVVFFFSTIKFFIRSWIFWSPSHFYIQKEDTVFFSDAEYPLIHPFWGGIFTTFKVCFSPKTRWFLFFFNGCKRWKFYPKWITFYSIPSPSPRCEIKLCYGCISFTTNGVCTGLWLCDRTASRHVPACVKPLWDLDQLRRTSTLAISIVLAPWYLEDGSGLHFG